MNQNFTARSTSTPSTRHLLDGVAMSVPHRSTSQRGHVIADAPDTLVDFHTGTHSVIVAGARRRRCITTALDDPKQTGGLGPRRLDRAAM